jgi:hypothetical protein
MTKDVNVTISAWGGMLFPREELRATLTYLSYKVGLPVLFEPLELREVREGSFSPGPADAVHVCVLRDEEALAEGSELPVCLEGRGYSLRGPGRLSLDLWTPWTAKCVRDHSVGSLGVPLAVVFAHYVVFLVDFTQASGDGAQAVLRHVIEQAVGLLDLTAARALQEQRLAELEAVLAPWFREAVKHEQFELEGRIGRLKNSLTEAARILVDGERELPVLEGELTFLRTWAAEPRDGRVEAEVARLKQLVQGGFYREISVRSDAICGRTHPIVIDHDGYEFAVGTYEVTVAPTGSVRIQNLAQPPEASHPHPHVGSEGTPCWGSAYADVLRAQGRLQVASVLALAHSLLSSYNRPGAYEEISHFDPVGGYEGEPEDPCAECDDSLTPYCIHACEHNEGGRFSCSDCPDYREEWCFTKCEYNRDFEQQHPCDGCRDRGQEYCFRGCPYNRQFELQSPCENCHLGEGEACAYETEERAACTRKERADGTAATRT